MHALETAGAAESTKMTVALETGLEAAAKKDGYSEESMALASNLEARCVPLAIQWSSSWRLQVQSPPRLHLQGIQASPARIRSQLHPPRQQRSPVEPSWFKVNWFGIADRRLNGYVVDDFHMQLTRCHLRDIIHRVHHRRCIIIIITLELRGGNTAFPIRWCGASSMGVCHVQLR